MSDWPQRSLSRQPWTRDEDRILIGLWGTWSPANISQRLGRSLRAVCDRSRRLRLRGKRGGLARVGTLVRVTGYDRSTILLAIQHLRLPMIEWPTAEPCPQRKQMALGGKSVDLLVAYLTRRADGQRTVRPGLKRAARGAWDCAGKPPACVDHGDATRPHYALGRCERCYHRRRAEEARLPADG